MKNSKDIMKTLQDNHQNQITTINERLKALFERLIDHLTEEDEACLWKYNFVSLSKKATEKISDLLSGVDLDIVSGTYVPVPSYDEQLTIIEALQQYLSQYNWELVVCTYCNYKGYDFSKDSSAILRSCNEKEKKDLALAVKSI